VVTFNPLNRALRAWAVYSDRADAFNAASKLIKGRTPWRRRPDITVIDVRTNTVTEFRLLRPDWKPREWPMPTE